MRIPAITLYFFSLFFSLLLSFSLWAQQGADAIGQESVLVSHSNPNAFIENKIEDLQSIVANYHLALDSGSTIVGSEQIAGLSDQPVMKVSVQKCVVFICKVIDIDMEFSVRQVSGSCSLNYVLTGDLRRSSSLLSDLYSGIQMDVCFNSNATGGVLQISGSAIHAPNYSSGILQGQVLNMLQLQMPALLTAVRTVLAN